MFSLIVYYGLPPTTMDAVLATIVAGRQAQIRLNIRSIQIYYFLHKFIKIELNPSTVTLENICARQHATRTAWIHQTHAAGGASSSITMVVVLVGCLC